KRHRNPARTGGDFDDQGQSAADMEVRRESAAPASALRASGHTKRIAARRAAEHDRDERRDEHAADANEAVRDVTERPPRTVAKIGQEKNEGRDGRGDDRDSNARRGMPLLK